MKLKREYVILAAVMLALVSYLVFRQTDRTHYQLPNLPEVAANKISKLEIEKSGDWIVLNQKDNRWFIGPQDYPADAGKVNEMLDTIKNLSVTALVSESRNYGRYDLDDSKKISVKAWSGNTLSREFAIGKAASTYRHTHILLASDPNVYHAEGNFRNTFDQTVDNLRDLGVLAFDHNTIHELEITEDQKTTVVSRKELPVAESEDKKSDTEASGPPETKTVWQTADGQTVDTSRLNSLLSTLSRLKCEKYLDEGKKDQLKNPIWALTLKENNKLYALSIFAKSDEEDQNYPALSSENAYPFLLSGFQVDNMKKNIDEMLKSKDKS